VDFKDVGPMSGDAKAMWKRYVKF